ncbi:hypothetical protein DW322_11145 [Rhodococcus rhodnii]|uniref:HNH endonuclease n=1 Tax=Rhodococcus rhodnii TaxID=38312 RepID=A0A6P2CD35_9NOCA|nr:NUMOD4 motif-containing HNH endonuclease [Rhodococcus rhodnii]TXG90667.1 hypothetical protein DW322_11145 [Rhodococcus rhodnii]
MTEEWRDILGYEGSYQVSDTGRVRSLDRLIVLKNGSTQQWRGRVLSPGVTPYGHQTVRLMRGGTGQSTFVHRLVAIAFIGAAPAGHECCHRDGDPINNNVSNLYWGTRSDNLHDQVRHGVHVSARKTHCVHGHPFTPENTYMNKRPGGGRICKTCTYNRKRAARARRQKASNV